MATQLMIYETAVPVSPQRHGGWSVKTGKDYSFARHLNSIPLIAAEFARAAAEYPIVFAGAEDEVLPAVVLGARDRENLYLSSDGAWQAKYIPAFIRRYPFVFASTDDGTRFTLCIDEQFSGCNQDGRGERLFDADGEQTQYLGTVLEFLKHYQVQFQRSRAFCAKLKDLELLEPMRAQFKFPSGEEGSLGGFMAVSRERLKALSDEQLVELMRSDELELVYLHLQSMHNFSMMVERRQAPAVHATETAPAVAESTDPDAPEPEAAIEAEDEARGETGLH
jgi:hypothetical protein